MGFYVTEYNSAGAQVYNANIATGTIYPFRVRVYSAGNAYAAGYLSPAPPRYRRGQTPIRALKLRLPTAHPGSIASGGATVPYATYFGGTDSSDISARTA